MSAAGGWAAAYGRHADLARLPDGVRHSLLGNVGNLIAFRAGAEEATRLARELPGLDAADIMGLARFEVAARLTTGTGDAGVIVTGRTERPPPLTGQGALIRTLSAEHYGGEPRQPQPEPHHTGPSERSATRAAAAVMAARSAAMSRPIARPIAQRPTVENPGPGAASRAISAGKTALLLAPTTSPPLAFTASPVEMSERDRVLLGFVADCRLASGNQLTLRFWLAERGADPARARAARRALKRLRDWRVLGTLPSRARGGVRGGSATLIYHVGVAGAKLFGRARAPPATPRCSW